MANVRRLEVEFIGDVSSLEKANRQLQRDLSTISKQLDDASKSGKSFADSTDDLGTHVERAATSAQKLGTEIKGLGDGSRDITTGFGQASTALKSAQQQIDQTGRVSQSTLRDLKQLGSDGVDGLDKHLTKTRATLTKAATEIETTGSVSRRTRKDLEDLGDGSDHTGRGLSGLIAGFGGAGNGAEGLSGILGPLGGGLSGTGAAALAAVPALFAFAGAGVAVASALAPLAGLAGAGAVGLSAFGQAAGVAVLASLGVADALKEQNDAQGKASTIASTAADQARTSARAIASAQDGVRTANEQVRTATEALTTAETNRTKALAALGPAQKQAARDLQDLRSQVANAIISEKQAALSLTDARKALSDALKPADAMALAAAQSTLTTSTLSEQHAVLALTDARQALADLMKPADALDLADAQDAVADSARNQTRATLALQDAQANATAVANNPMSTDEDKAKAALDLADAQNAVGDAARDSTRAQQQLQKLQAPPDAEAVAKAKLDISDAEQAVTDATNGTAQAQKDLNDAQAGADPEAVAKAKLDVASAEQALADATRDRARLQKDEAAADKKGVSGAAGVVAAKEAIRDADKQVSDAERGVSDAGRDVTKAMQAVKDAQIDAASAAKKAGQANADLNQKFDALPPAAQAFVRSLQALKPKLDDLRQTAAAGLFPGVVKGLEAAEGAFKPVKMVVGETAKVLGSLATKAGELVGSKAFGSDIEKVGSRNTLIIGRLGDAAIHVVSAIRNVIVAAGPLTTWLAKVADGWAKSTDAASDSARKSGALSDFFDKTKTVLKTVGSIVGNLATAFYNVGRAAAPFGTSTLGSITDITKKFAEWTGSVKGQTALRDFFKKATTLAGQLAKAIAAIASTVTTLAVDVMPPFAKILQVIGPHLGTIVKAFLAWRLAMTAVSIATNVLEGAMAALNFVMDANPVTLTALALVALGAGLYIAYQKVKPFHDAVDAAWGVLKDVADWVGAHWELVLGTITGPIGPAVVEIIKHFGEIKDAVTGLPGDIADAVKSAPDALAALGGWILDTIISAFKAQVDVATGAAKWTLDTLKGALDGLASLFENRGKDVLGWIVGGFKAVTSGLTGAARWMLDTLKGGVDALADLFGNRGKDILGWIVGGVKAAASAVAGIGGWLLDRVKASIDAVAGLFGNRGKDVIGWIVDGLTFITDKGVSAVTGVGDWLLKQLKADIATVKEEIAKVGGDIIGWIIGGLEKGAYDLQGFLNKIITLINKLPMVKIKPIDVLKKDDKGNVTGFAHGGAYARTGGIVDSPITLMGEEAPRHKEIVVPTNPAYRPRAQKLAMMAANAVGLATGGTYSFNQIEDTWKQGGGDPGKANTMAWIAEAESGGDPTINYGGGHNSPLGQAGKLASGLWQILGLPFPGDVYDPVTNARMAKAKSADGTNLSPWDSSRSVWGPHLGSSGGGILGSIGHAVGGAVTGAVGAVGDVIGDVLGKLPGIGDLPDWLKGTGTYVLGKVKDYISGAIGGLIPGGGSGGGAAGSAGTDLMDGHPVADWIYRILAKARQAGVSFAVSSGYRSDAEQKAIYDSGVRPAAVPKSEGGPGSNHEGTVFPLGAVDVSPGAAALNAWLQTSNYASDLIYAGAKDPVHFSHPHGGGYAMGGIYGLPFAGSFDTGGTVGGPKGAPAVAVVHGGEEVSPAGRASHGDENQADLAAAMRELAASIRAPGSNPRAVAAAVLDLIMEEKLGVDVPGRKAAPTSTTGAVY